MDAVQRMRKKAKDAGNLKSTEQVKVETKTVESQRRSSWSSRPIRRSFTSPAITRPWFMVLRSMPILQLLIRHRAITRQAWRFRSAWELRWARCGAADGVTTADGAATTTSPSITTTTSSTTATVSMAATASMAGIGVTATGSTIRSTAAELLTAIEAPPTGLAARRRGDSMQNRQSNARQNVARQQPAGGMGNRGTGPSAGNRDMGNRGAGAGAGNRDMGNRGAGAGNMGGSRGGGERVGNQRVPNSPSSTNRSAFGGSGMSGSGARASQSRGASSMGSRGGGCAWWRRWWWKEKIGHANHDE